MDQMWHYFPYEVSCTKMDHRWHFFMNEGSCTKKWWTKVAFFMNEVSCMKKLWTMCDIVSWMKFHMWKMWWTRCDIFLNEVSYVKNVMDQMWHFREWSFIPENVMDQTWNFREWSFLYKISHYSVVFCEWIYVWKCHVWSIAEDRQKESDAYGAPTCRSNTLNATGGH